MCFEGYNRRGRGAYFGDILPRHWFDVVSPFGADYLTRQCKAWKGRTASCTGPSSGPFLHKMAASTPRIQIQDDHFINHFFTFIHCMYDHSNSVPHDRSSSRIPVFQKMVALSRCKCEYSTLASTLVDYCMIRLNLDTIQVGLSTECEQKPDLPVLPFAVIPMPDTRTAGILISKPLTIQFLDNVRVMMYTFERERIRVVVEEVADEEAVAVSPPKRSIKSELTRIFQALGSTESSITTPMPEDGSSPDAELLRNIKVNRMGFLNLFTIWNLFERALNLDAHSGDGQSDGGRGAAEIRIDTVTTIRAPFCPRRSTKRPARFNYSI